MSGKGARKKAVVGNKMEKAKYTDSLCKPQSFWPQAIFTLLYGRHSKVKGDRFFMAAFHFFLSVPLPLPGVTNQPDSFFTLKIPWGDPVVCLWLRVKCHQQWVLQPHVGLPGITSAKPNKASHRLRIEKIMLASHTLPPLPAKPVGHLVRIMGRVFAHQLYMCQGWKKVSKYEHPGIFVSAKHLWTFSLQLLKAVHYCFCLSVWAC